MSPVRKRAAETDVLELIVQNAVTGVDRESAPKKSLIRGWARAALLKGAAEVAIRLVGEAEGRELNRTYRGKDQATNVLTFVYGEGESMPELSATVPLRGDLVLCVPVVVREAGEQGKTPETHFAHMVVHGMLHLQGFDHQEAQAAAAMEALEGDILATFGYDNPYA